MKRSLFIFLVFNLSLNLVILKANCAKSEKERGLIKMRVKFYTLDIENRKKGDFVGEAIVKENGKIVLNISDAKLKEILTQPYKGLEGGRKGNEFVDKEITYLPGTVEHLKAIAIECYRFGYIGEIVKDKDDEETKEEVGR